MASVQKRDKDSWRVRWREPDGAERNKTYSTRDLAEEVEKRAQRAEELGLSFDPDQVAPRLCLHADIAPAYLRDCERRDLAARTRHRYAEMLEIFFRWLRVRDGRAYIDPAVLSWKTLDSYWSYLKTDGRHGHGRKLSTCNAHISCLNVFWEWAHKHHPETPRPVPLELPSRLVVDKAAPTWEQMDACLREAEGPIRRRGIVLRCTGLRVGQVMGLLWTDLDLRRETLRIRPEAGKSRAEKTGRVVPLAPVLADALRAWREEDREAKFVVPALLGNTGRSTARTMPEREPHARDMARCWAAAGVPPERWESPHHAFRAGFTSALRQAGAAHDAIDVLTGHRLPGVRQNYTDTGWGLPLRLTVCLVPPVIWAAPSSVDAGQLDMEACRKAERAAGKSCVRAVRDWHRGNRDPGERLAARLQWEGALLRLRAVERAHGLVDPDPWGWVDDEED